MWRLNDPKFVLSLVALLVLVTGLSVASLLAIKKKESELGAEPALAIAPAVLTATLRPEGRRQPRGGEVPFTINFGDTSPSGVTITARFRWAIPGDDQGSNINEERTWLPSPSLRLVSRNEESIEGRIQRTITIAASVPAMPTPPKLSDRAEQPLGFDGFLMRRGLWHDAEMDVKVTRSDPANLLDAKLPVLPVQISSRSIAAGIALSGVFSIICVLTLSYWLADRVSIYGRSKILVILARTVLGKRPRDSLPRFQLLLWTSLIVFATLYFYGLTQVSDVPGSVFAVFGVVAATYVAAKTLVEPSSIERDAASGSDRCAAAQAPDIYDLVARDSFVDLGRVQLLCVTLSGVIVFATATVFVTKIPSVPTLALMAFAASNFIYLFSTTSFLRTVVAKTDISDQLVRSVQAVMLGPDATAYKGFASLAVECDQPPNFYMGRLEFSTEPDTQTSTSNWVPITIEEGRQADPVLFSIVARCDDEHVPEIERDLSVPARGSQTTTFGFAFPSMGKRHIWVTILQANRMVQILEAEVDVSFTSPERPEEPSHD
jgi:hypothetical protein